MKLYVTAPQPNDYQCSTLSAAHYARTLTSLVIKTKSQKPPTRFSRVTQKLLIVSEMTPHDAQTTTNSGAHH
jgi:hypothetical protein